MTLATDLTALLVADRVSTKLTDLENASHDESSCSPSTPKVVVWPLTTDEVVRVVRYAYEQNIPLTARGAGSSLEGNPIPVCGGIVLDLSRMSAIVAVHVEDLQVTVQPGIVYNQLNEQLKSYGLFFPPSPGGSSDVATIGGMVATRASGTNAVRYGTMRENVLSLTAVTAAGFPPLWSLATGTPVLPVSVKEVFCCGEFTKTVSAAGFGRGTGRNVRRTTRRHRRRGAEHSACRQVGTPLVLRKSAAQGHVGRRQP